MKQTYVYVVVRDSVYFGYSHSTIIIGVYTDKDMALENAMHTWDGFNFEFDDFSIKEFKNDSMWGETIHSKIVKGENVESQSYITKTRLTTN